jgi:tripartite-type tricarboxylate transporter receptor subunit TctC
MGVSITIGNSRGDDMARLAVFAFALLTGLAHAQAPWPAKPVRLILSNAAGSAPDVVARVFADQLSKAFAQPWLIENRPGGEGVIGAEAAARSAPDGYTFYLGTIVAIAVQPHLVKSLPFDSLRDFAPVAMVIDSGPSAISVHPDLPIRNVPELVAYAKANPGKLSFSSTVAVITVQGEYFNHVTGIKMTAINYKDPSQATQDAIAGRTPVMVNALAPMVPHIRSGKLRLVAVTSLKRLAAWPDTQTVAEFYPGFEAEGWLSLVAPTGVSADTITRVNREMERIVRSPQFREPVQKFSWDNLNGASTPQALAQFYRAEREKWGRIIRDIGMAP